MRANYFHYKIAASIAVLALAVPMSLYLYKQDMSSGAPALLEPKLVASKEIAAPPLPVRWRRSQDEKSHLRTARPR